MTKGLRKKVGQIREFNGKCSGKTVVTSGPIDWEWVGHRSVLMVFATIFLGLLFASGAAIFAFAIRQTEGWYAVLIFGGFATFAGITFCISLLELVFARRFYVAVCGDTLIFQRFLARSTKLQDIKYLFVSDDYDIRIKTRHGKTVVMTVPMELDQVIELARFLLERGVNVVVSPNVTLEQVKG